MMNQPNEKHSLVGKIYEYIYLQKPIIVYEKYKSETSKLVLKYDLGFSVNSENELGNLLKNFDKRKGYINLSDQTREHFNLKNCMIKLCKEIELIKKITRRMLFWIREMSHLDLAYQMMDNVAKDIALVAKFESDPKMEGRQMVGIVIKL